MSDDKPQRPRLGRGLSALLGDEGSDYAALDAVRKWKYSPTVVNGVAVPVTMVVHVTFAL